MAIHANLGGLRNLKYVLQDSGLQHRSKMVALYAQKVCIVEILEQDIVEIAPMVVCVTKKELLSQYAASLYTLMRLLIISKNGHLYHPAQLRMGCNKDAKLMIIVAQN